MEGHQPPGESGRSDVVRETTSTRSFGPDSVQGSAQAHRLQKGRVVENFQKIIVEYNRQRGMPILAPPQIESRPVNLYVLYGYVLKAGGSEVVDANHHWNVISKSLGFPGQEETIAEIHKRYLKEYEKEWLAKRRATSQSSTIHTPYTSQGQAQGQGQESTVEDFVGAKAESLDAGDDSKNHDTRSIVTKGATYRPIKRKLETYLGLDTSKVCAIARDLVALQVPPTFQELGRLDIQAMSRSIQSALPAEVENALNILNVIANDRRWGLPLVHCTDLLEALMDCLDPSNGETQQRCSTEFRSFGELRETSRLLTLSLGHAEPFLGLESFDKHIGIRQSLTVMTILRNFAFTEINQVLIATFPRIGRILSNTIKRFYVSVNQFINGDSRLLSFAKDMITFLSLISTDLILEDLDCAQTIFNFIESFSPDDARIEGGLTSFEISSEPYLAPAIDAAAKLLSRDAPNRQLYEEVLAGYSISERSRHASAMMAMAMLVVPMDPYLLDFRLFAKCVPLLQHALIVAGSISDLCATSSFHASDWIVLSNLASHRRLLDSLLRYLSRFPHELLNDTDITAITKRSASILKKLQDKSRSTTHTIENSVQLSVLLLDFPFEV